MAKLTDTQRVVLSAAAARITGNALPIPESLGFSAGTKAIVVKSLLTKGQLTERPAIGEEPVWRVDDETRKIALAISPAGLEAIAVEPDVRDKAPAQPAAVVGPAMPHPRAKTRHVPPVAAKPARETKQSLVIAMLRRQEGASVEEIAAATEWAPHSVRGFMSGALKKRLGMTIASIKLGDGSRRYYISEANR